MNDTDAAHRLVRTLGIAGLVLFGVAFTAPLVVLMTFGILDAAHLVEGPGVLSDAASAGLALTRKVGGEVLASAFTCGLIAAHFAAGIARSWSALGVGWLAWLTRLFRRATPALAEERARARTLSSLHRSDVAKDTTS